MRRLIYFLVLLAIMSGCVSATKTSKGDINKIIRKVNTHKIEIISEPPGAKIEIDNQYIGETPCMASIYVPGFLKSGGKHKTIRIKAFPTQPGHYTQRKIIYSSDVIPTKMFFDMRLKPVPKEIDINLAQ